MTVVMTVDIILHNTVCCIFSDTNHENCSDYLWNIGANQ